MEEYNLAGIRQQVLVDRLDDDEFDPGIVDRAINNAQKDIFNSYGLTFMEKIFSGTVPAGTTMFKMPDDVIPNKIQSQIISGTGVQSRNIKDRYIPFRDFNRIYPIPTDNQAGPIWRWSMYSGNMLLPQPTDREYTLTLYYLKKPVYMTEDTSIPEIPEEFSELLVIGAYIRILRRNEDNDLADNIEQHEWTPKIQELVEQYGMHQEGPIIMKNGYKMAGSSFNTTRNGLVQKSY